MWDDAYLPNYGEAFDYCKKKRADFKEWYEFIDKSHVYEVLNSNHLDALAKVLSPYKTILEVGAGNGRLSHFLRERLPDASIVATDNGSWNIEPVFPVEKMEIEEALEKYQPEIVISCWMLYRADWTPLFRKCGSVKGYILIGESDGGCCGTESLWFGHEGKEPGYLQDGFIRQDLDELSKMQICRTDFFEDDDYATWNHSYTVFFKRES